MKLYTREEYNNVKQTTLADKGKSHCPFCHRSEQGELILWEGEYWYVMHNKFPIGGRSDHLMAIPKRCVEFTQDLTSQEMGEFPKVEKFMTEFYKGHDDYWSMIRQRSDQKSILHLHYHYLPGNIIDVDITTLFDRQKIKSNI